MRLISYTLTFTGTNDIRFRQTQPNHPNSRKNPHLFIRKIISHLKAQTKPENIVVLESAPSTKFDITPYNKRNQEICHDLNVGFANTLVRNQYLVVFIFMIVETKILLFSFSSCH